MSRLATYGPPYALEGRRVLVVGLARSGLAAARLCAAKGAAVKVTDRRGEDEIDTLMLTGLPVTQRLGEHRVADFVETDLVIVSPGVPLGIPELLAAREAGVPVIGEVELAWSFLEDVPTLGITGTNGKSTTTALAGAILAADGRRPFVGGNLGRALSEAVLEEHRPGALVLELSSFQLDTIVHLRPDVAVILNLTPDHLDRHGSVEAYGAAKARIFMNQAPDDHAIVPGDDPAVVALAGGTAAKKHPFVQGDAPVGGAGFAGSDVVLNLREEIERYPIRAPSLRGPHNLANAAAAALACRLLDASPTAVQHALDHFAGLPHRLERIRVRDGVEWINDSKATNPDSAAVALRSFEGGVVWIAGGRGKGTGYAAVAEAARGRVKAVLTLGEDGEKLADALRPIVGEAVEEAGELESAVTRAAALATHGDVVLLSPACASFDQFESYEARGAAFRRLVEGLS
jgi:UDP-N-acetylmuramoylalanine--D-glutamate ligase